MKAADFGHADLISYDKKQRIRRVCKCYVEDDRSEFAKEHGYFVAMLLMQPTGWPCNSRTDGGSGQTTAVRTDNTETRNLFSIFSQSELDKLREKVWSELQLNPVSSTVEDYLFP